MDSPTITLQPTAGFGAKPGGELGELSEIQNEREFYVKQKMPGCAELCGAWEYNNKFEFRNSQQQMIYFGKEEASCMQRSCCGNAREFEMGLTDSSGKEVLRFHRPLKCLGCCCMCCYPGWTQVLSVTSATGAMLGEIREVPAWTYQHLEILNESGIKEYDIRGPCCTCSCGSPVQFFVSNTGGSEVAVIERLWTGCSREAFTDTDNFHVEITGGNLSLKDKAMLFGATILIDMIYFERNNNE